MHLRELDEKISDASIVVAIAEQVSSNLDGETAILNLKSGVYSGLNQIGSHIWNLIQKPQTVREIKEILLQEYEVDAETCERDVIELLLNLQAADLIEVSHETTT